MDVRAAKAKLPQVDNAHNQEVKNQPFKLFTACIACSFKVSLHSTLAVDALARARVTPKAHIPWHRFSNHQRITNMYKQNESGESFTCTYERRPYAHACIRLAEEVQPEPPPSPSHFSADSRGYRISGQAPLRPAAYLRLLPLSSRLASMLPSKNENTFLILSMDPRRPKGVRARGSAFAGPRSLRARGVRAR